MGNERRSRYESAPRPARQERSRGMPSARASSGWSRSRFPLSAPSAPGRSGPASLRRRVPAARSVGSGLHDRTRRGGPGGGPLDREREGLAGRLTTTAALRGRLGGTSCLATTTPLDRRSLLRRGLPATTPLDRRSLLRRGLPATAALRGRLGGTGFRAVVLRAVLFLARRLAGLRPVVFFAALLRALRLFAGGTVTYLSRWFAGSEADRLGSTVSGVHLLLEVGTH